MIIVFAKIIPKDGKTDEIVEKAQDMINKSRKEEGNISYNLFKQTEDDSLQFVEQWESKEILEKHMKTEHFLSFGKVAKELVAGDMDISVFLGEKVSE